MFGWIWASWSEIAALTLFAMTLPPVIAASALVLCASPAGDNCHMSGRVRAFAVVIALAVGLVAGYALVTSGRSRPASPSASNADPAATGLARMAAMPAPPFAMVRSLIPDDSHGRVGVVPLSAPEGPRFLTTLACERVFYASGRGVCLTLGTDGMRTTYTAEIFDGSFEVRGRVPLTGVPSRVRLSPDGRRAGITVFEEGHSYAEQGFSTRTTLIDTTAASVLAELESFAVTRDGRRFREVDFNFWGVTFAKDGNRFYATLASGGVKYLVEGDVDARSARVITRDVECPSISPDNTRIAYKKAYTDARGIGWTLHVLDLATLSDTTLGAETRSVDDQVEWLDDGHVIYHLPSSRGADIWVMSADGQLPPSVLIPLAYSPAVVR